MHALILAAAVIACPPSSRVGFDMSCPPSFLLRGASVQMSVVVPPRPVIQMSILREVVQPSYQMVSVPAAVLQCPVVQVPAATTIAPPPPAPEATMIAPPVASAPTVMYSTRPAYSRSIVQHDVGVRTHSQAYVNRHSRLAARHLRKAAVHATKAAQ